jgi:hypothetical protein
MEQQPTKGVIRGHVAAMRDYDRHPSPETHAAEYLAWRETVRELVRHRAHFSPEYRRVIDSLAAVANESAGTPS